MPALLALALLPPALLSASALRQALANITRLRTYEAQSQRAAEWSSTAAARLHRTRATQASAAVALALSLLAALYLLISPLVPRSPPPLVSTPLAALLTASHLSLARIHNARFWNEKEQVRIPFLSGYNEAVRGSERVVALLGWLVGVWGVVGAGAWVGGW